MNESKQISKKNKKKKMLWLKKINNNSSNNSNKICQMKIKNNIRKINYNKKTLPMKKTQKIIIILIKIIVMNNK